MLTWSNHALRQYRASRTTRIADSGLLGTRIADSGLLTWQSLMSLTPGSSIRAVSTGRRYCDAQGLCHSTRHRVVGPTPAALWRNLRQRGAPGLSNGRVTSQTYLTTSERQMLSQSRTKSDRWISAASKISLTNEFSRCPGPRTIQRQARTWQLPMRLSLIHI
eukprot:1889232-Rhodomonas_salina.3